ncbi:hypothetical protein HY637_03410 [Candidatus Woesearchaeota archaeon]|nr:hypothetical protein [Candidatus Woesearchaeota archaeon]
MASTPEARPCCNSQSCFPGFTAPKHVCADRRVLASRQSPPLTRRI